MKEEFMREGKTKKRSARDEVVENKTSGINNEKSIWDNLLKTLGVIVGLTGISGALLWAFGKSSYMGFFDSMNFPSTIIIQLPNEDYLLAGISTFSFFIFDLIFSAAMLYLAFAFSIIYNENIFTRINNRILNFVLSLTISLGLIGGGGYLLLQNISGITTAFFKDTGHFFGAFIAFLGFELLNFSFKAIKPDENKKMQLNEETMRKFISNYIRVIVVLIAILTLVVSHANSSYINGYKRGCQKVTEKKTPVILYSKQSMTLEGKTTNGISYIYNNYFLLLVDNDSYYLHREFNPDTLKPISLFIVNKDILETVEVLSVPTTNNPISYAKTCEKIAHTSMTDR